MSTPQLPLKVRLLQPVLMGLRPAFFAAWLKRLCGIERCVVRTDIGTFLVDPISNLGVSLIGGGYEPGMVETLRRYLQPSSIFVDVGANDGYFTVLGGSLVGPGGRVIAVEPQARLQAVLARNLQLNRLDNVSLYPVAISDSEGTAVLHLSPDLNTGSTGLTRRTCYKVARQPVRMVTLTRVLSDARVEQVDLMKMDIEGFEYEAVFGSRELFATGRIRAVALELHPDQMRDRGRDPVELVGFLRDSGYREDCTFGNTVFVQRDA